jgi:hypothetical protein
MPDDPDPFKLTGELYRDLIRRRPAIKKAADYYDGCHNLAFAGEKFLDAFGGQFRAFADNWCAVVTDAVEERLQIAGFRVNNEPKADDGAHKIWQTNDMDMQAQLGHTDGLHQGAFYVTCWPSGDETPPELTVDSCMGTIVRRHPKFRNRVTPRFAPGRTTTATSTPSCSGSATGCTCSGRRRSSAATPRPSASPG